MRRRLVILALLAATATYWLQRYLLLRGFLWRFTDEDQSILAVAVREIQQGRLHQPTFYGQSYGNWIEALLVVPLTPRSLHPAFTLPVATQLLTWIPFAIGSALEWRRGRTFPALLLLWLPCLMGVRGDLLLSLPRAWIPGLSIALTAAFLLQARPFRLAVAMVIACTLNTGAVLLAAPVLISAVLEDRSRWRRLVAGLAAGAPYPLAVAAFYFVNPHLVLHPSPAWTWSLELLQTALSAPFRFFGSVSGLLAVPIAAVCLRAARPSRAVLSALVFLSLAIPASLGLQKAHEGSDSIFLPSERFYLALPFLAAWVSWKLLAAWTPSKKAVVTLVVAGVCILTWKHAGMRSALKHEIAISEIPAVSVKRVENLLEKCEKLELEARRAGAKVVVFEDDRTAAYFCGAAWSASAAEGVAPLTTYFPSYERRRWIADPLVGDGSSQLLRVSGH